jgi:hypothetical protein
MSALVPESPKLNVHRSVLAEAHEMLLGVIRTAGEIRTGSVIG